MLHCTVWTAAEGELHCNEEQAAEEARPPEAGDAAIEPAAVLVTLHTVFERSYYIYLIL